MSGPCFQRYHLIVMFLLEYLDGSWLRLVSFEKQVHDWILLVPVVQLSQGAVKYEKQYFIFITSISQYLCVTGSQEL